MNGADNLYSRFVYWAKILLPLGALALLSTLFLFARGQGGEDSLPYAEIETIARENRLTAPNFAGVTSEGASYSISAELARPSLTNPDDITIDRIRAGLDSPDGLSVDITAGRGQMNATTGIAELSGLARLETSNGYQMETAGLIADFHAGRIESTGPLEVRAPFGAVTAGKVTILQGGGDQGAQILFNGGVRLIYQPEQ